MNNNYKKLAMILGNRRQPLSVWWFGILASSLELATDTRDTTMGPNFNPACSGQAPLLLHCTQCTLYKSGGNMRPDMSWYFHLQCPDTHHKRKNNMTIRRLRQGNPFFWARINQGLFARGWLKWQYFTLCFHRLRARWTMPSYVA